MSNESELARLGSFPDRLRRAVEPPPTGALAEEARRVATAVNRQARISGQRIGARASQDAGGAQITVSGRGAAQLRGQIEARVRRDSEQIAKKVGESITGGLR